MQNVFLFWSENACSFLFFQNERNILEIDKWLDIDIYLKYT